MASGIYDDTIYLPAWFDDTIIASGWWDEVLLPQTRGFLGDVGAYSESGVNPNLLKTLGVSLSVGSYTENGISINLSIGHTITASVGSFSESGVSLNFRKTLTVALAVASFILNGNAVTLAIGNPTLHAIVGAYQLTSVEMELVLKLAPAIVMECEVLVASMLERDLYTLPLLMEADVTVTRSAEQDNKVLNRTEMEEQIDVGTKVENG